jgi:hypothetical protein
MGTAFVADSVKLARLLDNQVDVEIGSTCDIAVSIAEVELLKKYHKITETNKFNKEKKRAILYKTVSVPFGWFWLCPVKCNHCSIVFSVRTDTFSVINGLLILIFLSVLINKITNTPISGINIK